MAVFVDAGLVEQIGAANVIPWEDSNPTAALAKAVRRAKELAGGGEAVLHVLTAPHPELPRPASAAADDWQI